MESQRARASHVNPAAPGSTPERARRSYAPTVTGHDTPAVFSPCCRGDVPHGRHLHRAVVVEPHRRSGRRIEDGVADDPVTDRAHAGGNRGVRGIGHRGMTHLHAIGERARVPEGQQVGNAHGFPGRIEESAGRNPSIEMTMTRSGRPRGRHRLRRLLCRQRDEPEDEAENRAHGGHYVPASLDSSYFERARGELTLGEPPAEGLRAPLPAMLDRQEVGADADVLVRDHARQRHRGGLGGGRGRRSGLAARALRLHLGGMSARRQAWPRASQPRPASSAGAVRPHCYGVGRCDRGWSGDFRRTGRLLRNRRVTLPSGTRHGRRFRCRQSLLLSPGRNAFATGIRDGAPAVTP